MKNNRHGLRKCALQAIVSLEFGQEPVQAAQFSYLYDREEEQEGVEIPLFLLNLVNGVADYRDDLDKELSSRLKAGWTLDRLTLIDKNIMRLGLFEILHFEETPDRVAVNEAIELAKEFSDESSAKFVNGVLSQFIKEEA
ncbi:transcription antitermination factor NusB [Streptococcus suis]|uniref:transcription antitermination factor NusB n=1 Tax=Streptococcus suis TaxID=1307 RepID=UPI000CF59D85|nr:transcription antitermination factor NusB [Streptococcus suis]NQI44014.1 transcription antitermination factor NusB [Streptococcus suis]NQJ74482.1 transcription antitermination factor NusB [Streptococcus suis]NQJ78724.1 transcription antitermination factor NusB [Streptococcus suis]